MPILEWDKTGDRVFESGVSQGVLYLEDGSGVPWNGLISVVQRNTNVSAPVYFDGRKVNDLVTTGDFSGLLTAFTYPDQLLKFEGVGEKLKGVHLTDQPPKTFAMSYRTSVGSDVDNKSEHYQIHLIYNVTAIPSDKNYASMSGSVSATRFSWKITAVPEEAPGFRPTAHLIFDSREVTPSLMADLEVMLYGGVTANASLPSFADLMEIFADFYLMEIVDNKDGTWTALTDFDNYITMVNNTEYTISDADVTYLDADTYLITSTLP